jgi:anti-anti-sigma factor
MSAINSSKESPVKCYEITKCSDKERESCYVWMNFKEHPEDMEDLKCWVIKGTYHEDQAQVQKCRKCNYYQSLNRDSGIRANHETDLAVVSCSGTINQEKTDALSRVWAALKKHNKHKVLLDVSNVNNIYSCGLSILVKMHKETADAGGMLVVVGGRDHLHQILHSSRLTRILHLAPEETAGRELFEAVRRKREEEQRSKAEATAKAAEEARRAAEAAKPKPQPKKFVRCWDYWKGRNPNNATTCDECFQKQNPKPQPCWIVEGVVEGVTFQFVNESCVDCRYFHEFGTVPQGQAVQEL